MIKYKIVFTDDITKENIFVNYLKQVNLLIKKLIIKENLQKNYYKKDIS